MPILRLAYATQFLLALIAVFLLWSEVGGQTHLDLMPWYLKLGLGGGAAFAVVKATAASVGGQPAWNARTLRWLGILVVLLIGCGLSSYYVHMYGESDEDDEDQDQDQSVASMIVPAAQGISLTRPAETPRHSGGPSSDSPGGGARTAPIPKTFERTNPLQLRTAIRG